VAKIVFVNFLLNCVKYRGFVHISLPDVRLGRETVTAEYQVVTYFLKRAMRFLVADRN
jgi:hypothetical protein